MPADGRVSISVELNGRASTFEVAPAARLVDFLRDECRLTGTRAGCLTGDCGACTVLLDGATHKSCLLLAASVDGRSVTTIEGLSDDGPLTDVQDAFWEENAFQCGFCTSGMVLVVSELLDQQPAPDEQEIRRAISGNLCRCTGYDSIVAAAQRVVRRRAAEGGAA